MESCGVFYLSSHYERLGELTKSVEHYIEGVLLILNSEQVSITRSTCVRLETLFAKKILRQNELLEKMKSLGGSNAREESLVTKHEGIMRDEMVGTCNEAAQMFRKIRTHIKGDKCELVAYVAKAEGDFLKRRTTLEGGHRGSAVHTEARILYEYALDLLASRPPFCPYRLDVLFSLTRHMTTLDSNDPYIKDLRSAFSVSRRFFMSDLGENARYYLHIMRFIGFYLDKQKSVDSVVFDTWLGGCSGLSNLNIIAREDFFVLYMDT